MFAVFDFLSIILFINFGLLFFFGFIKLLSYNLEISYDFYLILLCMILKSSSTIVSKFML